MYSCDIVVDKKLIMRATDDDFYRLVGEKNYGALTVSAHPDDLPMLFDAVEKLTLEEPMTIMCRFRVADDSYHYMMLKLSYENERCVTEDRLSISFLDMDAVSDAVNFAKSQLADAELMLGLTEAVLFEYNRSEKNLKIFAANWENRYILFDGSDKAWLKQSSRLPIVEADKEVLDRINDELLSGVADFTDSISFKQNVDDKNFKFVPEFFAGQCVTVKGKYVSSDGLDRVFGIISMKNASGAVGVEGFVDSCMDSTFNIYNKKTVTDYAQTSISQGKRGYICVMDIDNFKTVNDTYGHIFGDEVIKTVIDIVKANVKNAGMVGRIGGDEFMMVLDKDVSPADLRSKMRSIRSQVEYEFQNRGYRITVSIGCANYESDGMTYEKIFKLADKMLYRAKEKGRNRYIIYEPEIHGTPDEILSGSVVVKDKMRGNSTESKERFVMKFMELFWAKKTMSFDMAMEAIAEVFDLDEVHLFFENLEAPKYSYSVQHSVERRYVEFLDSEIFTRRINDQKVTALAHPNTLGDQDDILVKQMLDFDYEAMVVYKSDIPNSCFIFAKRGTDIRKWENSDVAYLGFLSKMIELEFDNR